MWSVEHQLEAPVDRAALWTVWANLERWPEWDPRSQWVRLNGPFKAGQRGRAKFRGAPASDYVVTSVDPRRMFRIETGSPLVKVQYEHELSDAPEGGAVVRHRVIVRGALAPLLAVTVRKRMRAYLPEKLRHLVAYASGDGVTTVLPRA